MATFVPRVPQPHGLARHPDSAPGTQAHLESRQSSGKTREFSLQRQSMRFFQDKQPSRLFNPF